MINRAKVSMGVLGLAVATFALVSAVSSAKAAAISWQTPVSVNTSNAAQVSTNGTYVDAGAFWLEEGVFTSTTVNGVLFKPANGTPGNPASSTLFVGSNISYTLDNLTGFVNATNSYEELLFFAAITGSAHTITISNLTPGNTYEVQLWEPRWNGIYLTDFSATNTVADLTTGFGATAPQYVIGTFTASGTSQSITYSDGGNGAGLFSAVQFRDITVPEPSAIALATLGLVGLFGANRRRQG